MNITVEELSLIVTWNEPFTLEGEELLYIVTITNTASGVQEDVTVNTTRYAFSKSFGERDCAEYQFTVFSENDYSKSMINVSEWKNIPTGTSMKYITISCLFVTGMISIVACMFFLAASPITKYLCVV